MIEEREKVEEPWDDRSAYIPGYEFKIKYNGIGNVLESEQHGAAHLYTEYTYSYLGDILCMLDITSTSGEIMWNGNENNPLKYRVTPNIALEPVEIERKDSYSLSERKFIVIGEIDDFYQLENGWYVEKDQKNITFSMTTELDNSGVMRIEALNDEHIVSTKEEEDYNSVVTAECVKKALGVPDDAEVTITYGDAFFWDAGNIMLVHADIYGIGKYEGYHASATFDIENGDVCTSVYTWSEI